MCVCVCVCCVIRYFFDPLGGVVFDRNVLLAGPDGHRFNAVGIQTKVPNPNPNPNPNPKT